jgi:hypothetical protein
MFVIFIKWWEGEEENKENVVLVNRFGSLVSIVLRINWQLLQHFGGKSRLWGWSKQNQILKTPFNFKHNNINKEITLWRLDETNCFKLTIYAINNTNLWWHKRKNYKINITMGRKKFIVFKFSKSC